MQPFTSSCGVRKIALATAILVVSALVVSIVCARVRVCVHTRARDVPVASGKNLCSCAFNCVNVRVFALEVRCVLVISSTLDQEKIHQQLRSQASVLAVLVYIHIQVWQCRVCTRITHVTCKESGQARQHSV